MLLECGSTMVKLEKCLIFSLQRGTIILASVFIVLSLVGCIFIIIEIKNTALDEDLWRQARGVSPDPRVTSLIENTFKTVRIAQLLLAFVLSSIFVFLISLALLIYGSISQKPQFLRPCMGITAMAIFTMIPFEIFNIANASLTSQSLSIISVVTGLIITSIFCYFGLVLHSFDAELRQGRS